MGSTCTIDDFDDNSVDSSQISINCTIPTDSDNNDQAVGIAGEHFPMVHFAGIGFALTSSITATTINAEINIIDTIFGSLNGGTLINIMGKNFGNKI